MFWVATCILIAIVLLIVGLTRSTLTSTRPRSFNASDLIEAVEQNRMLSCQGDVVFCYRLTLPPLYSLPADAYDRMVESWRIALKELPEGTIVQRMDDYDREPFDASSMPQNSYIAREEQRYAASRESTEAVSYLFVVFTGFRSAHEARYRNPFLRQSHKAFREEDAAYVRFTTSVESLFLQLQGAGFLDITPMNEEEIRTHVHYFFNGFQRDFLTDVQAEGDYLRAGDRYVGAVSIEHERQFPEVLSSPQEGVHMKIPVGVMEDLGCNLDLPHIFNQMIRLTGHEKEYALIKETIRTYRQNRGFSEENQDQTQRLEAAREEISDNLDALLVRGHTNIIFWAENLETLRQYRTRIVNHLKQVRDFFPVVPSGVELRNILYCSHPATLSAMDEDSFYLVDIKHTIALFQHTGPYRSDAEGIYFSDPIHHLPLRYDLYDARKAYVDSKNIAVVGRTGGGKSVMLEKVVEGFHNDPAHAYVDIIIDCGGSYDKSARLYAPEEVFIFRYNPTDALGLDPFGVGHGMEAGRIDDICELVWLIVKPGGLPTAEERVSMRKVVMMYVGLVGDEASWPDFYAWVRSNYAEILLKAEIRPEYFDVNQFEHNGSEWCEGGIFFNVFRRDDNPLTRFDGKKLLIFELENIKSRPQLLSIIVHLIGIAIRTLIWEKTARRGFIIYEEFAELMKIDLIFSAVLYQMQAIRKKGGAACIVLQNLDQLAMNAGDRYKSDGGAAKALMKNIETVIFLSGADPRGFEQYAPSFSDHDRQCVLALKNNYTSPPRYSSFYIYRTKRSTFMSLALSPRTYLAFQTEGEICEELGEIYAQTHDMERAIEVYEKRQTASPNKSSVT